MLEEEPPEEPVDGQGPLQTRRGFRFLVHFEGEVDIKGILERLVTVLQKLGAIVGQVHEVVPLLITLAQLVLLISLYHRS